MNLQDRLPCSVCKERERASREVIQFVHDGVCFTAFTRDQCEQCAIDAVVTQFILGDTSSALERRIYKIEGGRVVIHWYSYAKLLKLREFEEILQIHLALMSAGVLTRRPRTSFSVYIDEQPVNPILNGAPLYFIEKLQAFFYGQAIKDEGDEVQVRPTKCKSSPGPLR